MIIDTHCHIDLYRNPKLLMEECDRKGIAVISMTNLPTHFEMGYPFFRDSKNLRISLGLHPLFATKHKSEFDLFLKNIDRTSYIGEIGLDFSKEGIKTMGIQLDSFNCVLKAVSQKNKILSIHSRRAEKQVLDLLIKHNIKNAIFHWYTGPLSLIDAIISEGYYFSINPSMTTSANGQKIISKIPLSRILTESDGPYIQQKSKTLHPWDLKIVFDYIAIENGMSALEVERQIQLNFNDLVNRMR